MPEYPSTVSRADIPADDHLTSWRVQVSLDLQAIQRLALLAQQADLSTDDRIALARATQRLAGSAGCLTDAAQWPDAASVAASAAQWVLPDVARGDDFTGLTHHQAPTTTNANPL